MPPSPTMLDSIATIFRPTNITRDANQGVIQVFTVIQPAISCSQQQSGASKQQLYRQDNAFVGSTMYFADDPGTTADDYMLVQDDYTQVVNQYLVQGDSFPVARGELWQADCQQIQSPATIPTVVLPSAVTITDTTAILGGAITSDGASDLTSAGVLVSETATNDYPVEGGTGVVVHNVGSPAVGTFGLTVTGLTAGTRYSFRPFAINNVGTCYGQVSEFVTAS